MSDRCDGRSKAVAATAAVATANGDAIAGEHLIPERIANNLDGN